MRKWMGLCFLFIVSMFANELPLNLTYWDLSSSQPVVLTLVFSEAVVGTKDVASMKEELSRKVFFDFSPKLNYTLQVIDEKTVALTIKDTLLPAKRYYLTVKTTEKAMQQFTIGGKIFRANTPLFFETPKQSVSSATRASRLPDSEIRLFFSLPVDLKNLEKVIKITPSITFSMMYVTNRGRIFSNEVVIYPRGEKTNTLYTLTIDRSLTPVGGELPMAEDFRFFYKTYEPFTVEKIFLAEEDREYESYGGNTIVIKFNNGIADIPDEMLRRWVTVSPAVSFLSFEKDDNVLYLRGNFVPYQRYNLSIQSFLRDEFGQTLGREVSYSFQATPSPSYVYVPTGYLIMENYLANLLSLKTINIEGISFSYVSLTNPMEIAKFLLERNPAEMIDKLAQEKKEFQLPEKWNSFEIYKIPLKRYHPSDEGFLLYKVQVKRRTPASKYAWTPQAYYGYIQFTDISATFKEGPWGNMIIVRSLKNNAPVSNAKVYGYDTNTRRWVLAGVTSRAGILLETNVLSSLYMVESEKSRFYISSSYNHSFQVQYGYEGYSEKPGCLVFSDRYLYQPGERVFLKGIYRFRYKDSWVIEPKRKGAFRVEVYNSRDEMIAKTNFSSTSRGSFDFWVDIPKDAPTGEYGVRIFFEGDERYKDSWYSSFQVEEFRPARAEMRIQANKPLYLTGEKMKLDLIGWYLFGAPVGNSVNYTVSFRSSPYRSKSFPLYTFSSRQWWYEYDEDEYGGDWYRFSEIASGTLEPNAEGVASTTVDLSSIYDDGYLSIFARTTLPDETPVSGYKSDIEVRKELHLGIRLPSFFHSVNKPFSISLVALNEKDQVVTNQAVLVVTHHEWKSFRVAGHGGRFQWEWREVTTPVYSNQLAVHQSSVSLQIEKPGYYTATVYEKAGGGLVPHGRTWFYALGGGFYGWRIDDDERTEVISDKSEYSVGETATLLIQNPYPSARAVITVEREKFYKSYEIPATNSMLTFTLPIEEEYIPNIYVSVMLYTGRTGTNKVSNDVDYARPQYRIGYANLRVIPKEKTLSLMITTDKETYEPREKVKARVRVRDRSGNPVSAEVTLSVADRGVLNLVNYTLPNPLQYFYAPRGLAISTYETRNFIYGQRYLSEKGEILGGDGGVSLGMIVPRALIKYTAFYEAKLQITNGEGEVSFTLPDNLTSFKVMAVAHTTNSKFGYGESSFVVKRPLMVLESFPTFVRPKDEFMAGGMVFNYTGEKQTLTVEMSVSEELAVGGKRSILTNITLENNASREVLFPVLVKSPGTGQTALTLKVMGKGVSDGITKTIPIMIMRYPETVALYGMLSNQQNRASNVITVTTNVMSDLSSLEVTVAPTAFVELKGNLDYLVSYPYGCVEQKTSRILPLITGEDVILKYKLLHTKTKEDLRAIVQEVMNEVPEYFKEKGFSYWKDSSYISGYLTVYVFWVLTLARQAGYTINDAFYNRVFEVVKGYIQKNTIPDDFSSSYRWLTICYALYATSLNGYTDPSKFVWAYNEMKTRDPGNLSARAFFLMALAKYPDFREKAAIQKELVEWFEARKRLTGATLYFEDRTDWGWFYYSSSVGTALVLQAYLTAGITLPDAYKVINFLVSQRRGYAWAHTHENAWVFYAFSTYLKMFEKEEPKSTYEVLMNAKQILSGSFENRNQPAQRGVVSFGAEDMGEKNLQIARTGQGTLYYNYRYRYIPRSTPRLLENGFTIERKYIDLDTGKEVTVMERGKDYLVRITLSTPVVRHMVVVEDTLPAGLEVVNLSFATEGGNPNQERVRRESDEYDFWWSGFSHKEIYKDRVIYSADVLYPGTYTLTYLVRATLPGSFFIPGCHVEEMYNPENFATVYFPEKMIVQ